MAKSIQNAAIWGVIVLLAASGWLGWRFFGNSNRANLSERAIATRILAEELKLAGHVGPILVVSNPFSQTKGHSPEIYAYERAAIDGLKQGFGSATEMKVGFPALKPEVMKDPHSVYVDPQSTTPLSFLVTESAFDELIRAHPECHLVISLIG